nr:ABC transporter ATP-binding protein [Prochlorococcus marinus]
MILKDRIFRKLKKKLYLIHHTLVICKLGSKGNVLKFILLIIFSLLEGVSDTLPVLIVVPFLTLISNPEKIWNTNQAQNLTKIDIINQPSDLLLPAFILFVCVILFNTFLKLYTINFSNFVKASVGHQISKTAFEKIIFSNYEFQINTSSSKIIDDFYSSIGACLANIDSFLDAIRSLFTTILIIFSLFIINKEITFFVFIICGLTYFSTAVIKSRILSKNGRTLKVSVKKQTDLIQESWGYKKNIILENNQNVFQKKYSFYNIKYLFAKANINSAVTKPKFVIEGSFILIVGSIAFFLKTNYGTDPIPLLGAIALGLQKLLPNVNGLFQIYSAMVTRYERSKDIENLIKNTPQDLISKKNHKNQELIFRNLELKRVSYKYPGSKNFVINNGDISIKVGESVGIIGKTGSGKSTLINLLMGLLKPTEGSVEINGINITDNLNEGVLVNYRKNISHVPQSIFLNNVTILENIAFGEKILDINFEKVIEACKASRIYDFIKSTEKGFYSTVGERGIKISGGQLQRIALARALYKNKKILILDEATSALDNETEKEVINSIKTFDPNLTIIAIAHRLSTLCDYDRILKVSNGKIYNEKKLF